MMQDKDHQGFIKCFKENIKSITLVDIPNQENSIKKEDLKKKINGINKKINLGNSIEESIKAMNKFY
jgi:dihydrofolate synthase/folylpolyglutamate synthase